MLKPGTRQDVSLIRAGSYQGSSDVQDHYWYDTLSFQSSTISQMIFFTTGIQTGKVKQKTNLQDNGKFPTGQSFVTNAIGWHFLPKGVEASPEIVSSVVQDFYTVFEESTVELIVVGREFDFQAPASIWLPQVSVAQQTEAAAVGITEQRVGDFNHHSWLALKTPITISELVSFSVQVTINTSDPQTAAALGRLSDSTSALTAAELRCTLRGTLERLK